MGTIIILTFVGLLLAAGPIGWAILLAWFLLTRGGSNDE